MGVSTQAVGILTGHVDRYGLRLCRGRSQDRRKNRTRRSGTRAQRLERREKGERIADRVLQESPGADRDRGERASTHGGRFHQTGQRAESGREERTGTGFQTTYGGVSAESGDRKSVV